MQVQYPSQVKPAFGHFDAGNIGHPNLIDSGRGRQICQTIGRDGIIVVAVGRARTITPPLTSTELLLSHQPGDAVASVAPAFLEQTNLDARGTVRLAALFVEARNLGFEFLINLGSFAWTGLPFAPGIVTTGTDVKAPGTKSQRDILFSSLLPVGSAAGAFGEDAQCFF